MPWLSVIASCCMKLLPLGRTTKGTTIHERMPCRRIRDVGVRQVLSVTEFSLGPTVVLLSDPYKFCKLPFSAASSTAVKSLKLDTSKLTYMASCLRFFLFAVRYQYRLLGSVVAWRIRLRPLSIGTTRMQEAIDAGEYTETSQVPPSVDQTYRNFMPRRQYRRCFGACYGARIVEGCRQR